MIVRGSIALAAAFLLCGAALAHSEAQQAESAPRLDCEELPGAALTCLPSPFDEVARIECQPAGQFLVQGEGWIWRYPGSFTTRVHVPAWTPDPSSAAAGRYFTRAHVKVERGGQADALHRHFIEQRVPYTTFAGSDAPPAPQEIYTLTAVNDLGQALELHLVQLNGRSELWGVVCAPDCRSESSFIATSR
jgi:hypothetical protein